LKADLHIFGSPAEVAAAAAGEFCRRAESRMRAGKPFSCALSGGTTPLQMFEMLGNRALQGLFPTGFWDAVHFFWSDERDVPPDHPDSNYCAARETLFNRIPLSPNNVHRIVPEKGGAVRAAEEYEAELRKFFSISEGDFPRFDLIFLGMGADGHTASIFPGSDAVYERSRLVCAPWVQKLESYRVTLTPPVINNAACTIILVTGMEKADTIRRVLEGPCIPGQLPAQLITPKSGDLLWLLDCAAASKLAAADLLER
jgi:6-phosphogluconolactonase